MNRDIFPVKLSDFPLTLTKLGIPNFNLLSGAVSRQFVSKGYHSFYEVINYLSQINDSLFFSNNHPFVDDEIDINFEGKNSILALIAEENRQSEIQFIMGIYLLDAEIQPEMATLFSGSLYSVIPATHCFLRYKGERFDFFTEQSKMTKIQSRLVREQRIEPRQSGEWKRKIHELYLEAWLQRNPDFQLTLDQLLDQIKAYRSEILN